MKLETWLIANLTADPQNARTHDKRNLDAIATSLTKFGQRKPIVITPEGIILAGNGTVQAAKQLKWKEVQVTVTPKEWDYATARAYALADNRSAELAEWDTSVLASQLVELDAEGWDIGELGFDVPEPTEPVVEDEGPLTFDETEPITKLGDLYKLGNHRLLCGDSTDPATVAKLMDGKLADLVLTDPPFGNGVTGANRYGRSEIGNNKKATRTILGDADTAILETMFPALDSALKDNTHCLVWIQWRTFAELKQAFSAYRLRTVVIWDKKNAGLGSGFAEQYEMLCVFIKGETTQNAYSGNVWSISREHSTREGMEHPHKKPIEVLAKAINLTSQPKDLVLDLFGGSGSTLIACEQTNRTCLMMELDPKYCDVIVKRWEALTGKKAELVTP